MPPAGRRIAAGALVAITLLLGVGVGLLHSLIAEGPLEQETAVVIPRGAGLNAIAQRLTEAGVVRKPWQAVLAAWLKRAHRQLQAGEFAFPAGASPSQVIEILRSGETVIRRFTVAEGLTSAQVAQLLEQEPSLSGTLPGIPPEGSILPATYHYSWGDSRAELVERMKAKMREVLAELWPRRAPDSPVRTPEEAVILASIVEKETSVAAERARIAGVFANRLSSGMRLQSDPTVVYGLTVGAAPLGRALTRGDVRQETPYNTYVIDGLPPGPIANPGRASLEAVLSPEQHGYLYFVADGSGGHAFAKTLNEHNRNVARWRSLQRESAQQSEAPAPE